MEVREPSAKYLAKAAYKQTEVGVIPEDWDCPSISELAGNCANAIVGGPFGSDLVSKDYAAAGVPVVRGQNMGSHYVSGEFVFVSESKAKYLQANTARPNDIIFTQRGTLGQVSLVPSEAFERYIVSQSQMKLTLRATLADPEYTYHYFLSAGGQKQIFDSAIQTGVPHTNLGILRSYRLPHPPTLAEQQAIAEALSDADALMEALEQLLAKKRQIKQGAMQELLTGQKRLPGFAGEWEVRPMHALGQTYGGLTGKSKADFGHGRARYIPFMNVMSDTVIDPGWFELVDVASGETQNAAQRGDLFFNGSSETPEEVGFCSVLLHDVSGLYLNSFCFGFRMNPESQANGLFLAYWFRSRGGRKAMSLLAQGATRYNIAKSAFLKLEVPQPSEGEQTAIATLLSDMDAEIAALEAKLGKARGVKQGMMQELLTGRIRLV